MDNLYVQDGAIKDSHLEHLFDDILSAKYDDITRKNIVTYLMVVFPEFSIFISEDIIDDYNKAMRLAVKLGYVTIWELDEEDIKELDKALQKENPKYGAKIGSLEMGAPVVARTEHDVLLLAMVQYMRELLHHLNNRQDGTITH